MIDGTVLQKCQQSFKTAEKFDTYPEGESGTVVSLRGARLAREFGHDPAFTPGDSSEAPDLTGRIEGRDGGLEALEHKVAGKHDGSCQLT